MSKNATTKEIQPTTRGRMATRVVATCALLCALSVVFARFTTVILFVADRNFFAHVILHKN